MEPLAPVTGVARGGLGTATNLDDTQVYALDDLRDPLPAAPQQEPEVEPEARPVADRSPEPRAQVAPARRPIAAPAAVAAAASSRPQRSVGRPILGIAGVIAAVALAVVVGSSVLANRDGGGLGAGQSLPTHDVGAGASVLPSEIPGDTGRGSGKGNGNGNGPKKN